MGQATIRICTNHIDELAALIAKLIDEGCTVNVEECGGYWSLNVLPKGS